MLTNYSNSIFNVIQIGLNEAQHYIAGDPNPNQSHNNSHYSNSQSSSYSSSTTNDDVPPTFISRLTGAFIVAPLDLCIEVVRHVAIAVESAVFGVISFLSFIVGVDHAWRYTLINFDQAIYNLVLAVGKAVALPILMLPQMFMLGFSPQTTRPSYFELALDPKDHKIPENENMKEINYIDLGVAYEHNANKVQIFFYSLFNALAGNRDPGHLFFNESYRKPTETEYNQTSPVLRQLQNPRNIDNNNLFSTIILGPVLALADTIIEIAKPLFLAVSNLALATVELTVAAALIVTAPITLPLAAPIIFSNFEKYGAPLMLVGFASYIHLVSGIHYLAQAIASITMSPISLASQIIATWIDPQNVEPIYKGLYTTRYGDTRVDFSNIEMQVTDVASEKTRWHQFDSYETAKRLCILQAKNDYADGYLNHQSNNHHSSSHNFNQQHNFVSSNHQGSHSNNWNNNNNNNNWNN